MRSFVISVSFREEISSIYKRKMPQIDREIVEKVEVFVLFDTISVQFPRAFVISSNNQKRALHYVF